MRLLGAELAAGAMRCRFVDEGRLAIAPDGEVSPCLALLHDYHYYYRGRKRQVRRMFEALGLPVEELHRRRYGPLSDKRLAVGEHRALTAEEVDALRRAGEVVQDAVLGEPEEQPVRLSADAVAELRDRPQQGDTPV